MLSNQKVLVAMDRVQGRASGGEFRGAAWGTAGGHSCPSYGLRLSMMTTMTNSEC
jgi:hypothetical protein